MPNKQLFLAGVACLALASVAPPSFAQSAPGTSTPDASVTTVEDVIVTARRRVENLQDVPAAITAISGQDLSNTGAAGLEDFVRMAPGLNLGDTGFYGFKNFRIRGVATGTGAATVQAPVALYFDEVQTIDPYQPQGTADFYLTDIDRVEVLRGPQGTLFGSGSLSGAVRILTKKPELGVFSGSVGVTAETVADGGSGGTVEGMVNLPLGDRFAVRAVAYTREMPGWINNIRTGQSDVNNGESWGGRLAIRGRLTDNFTVTASVAHQHDEFGDSSRTFVDGGAGGSREWSVLTADRRTSDVTMASLVAEWDLGFASLTSATSYLDFHIEPRGGGDYLSALVGFPGTAMWQDLVSDNESFFQELRLASQSDGPFSWLVGLYYSDRDISLAGQFHNPVAEAFFGLPNLLDSGLKANVEEVALFGEVAFQLRDDLELSIGVRAFQNDFEARQTSTGLLTGFAVVTQGASNTERDASPRVTLTWEPSDDLTVYAQAARGYRIGQVNASLDASQGKVPPAFGPDQLWNYEVGAKGSFLEGRGRYSAALFYIDWQDIQLQLPGPTSPYTTNAGAARVIGLETELSIMLTENLELQNSIARTSAEIAESVPTLNQPSGVVGVFEGDPLPGSPRLTASTSLQYTRTLGNGAKVFLRGDHQFVGPSRNAFSKAGSHSFGDYHVFGLSAGYDLENGLGLRAYVKNLGDDDSATNVLFGSPGFGWPPQAIRLQPRTVGLTVRYNF